MDIVFPGEKLSSKVSNPERLFAAAYSACFNQAIKVCLEKYELSNTSEVNCTVDLFQLEDGTFKLGVNLDVHINELDQVTCKKVVNEADQICPYSRLLRGETSLNINILR